MGLPDGGQVGGVYPILADKLAGVKPGDDEKGAVSVTGIETHGGTPSLHLHLYINGAMPSSMKDKELKDATGHLVVEGDETFPTQIGFPDSYERYHMTLDMHASMSSDGLTFPLSVKYDTVDEQTVIDPPPAH